MSDNGQQVPLIERLRRVPAAARVLEHTPNPLGYDTTSIPVGALCQEAAARIDELERERDQYHDALIARHGGEPVALLGELDDARARIADLEADLERMTAARNRDHQQALMNGAALAAERERREAAEAELAVKRGRREAAEVIMREMAKLYAGQIDNTGNYCNQLHDSARAHFERYEKEPT